MNYLIYGTSYRLIENEIEKIVRDFEPETYDLEETDLKDILVDLSYTSLFSEEKYVIVKNASSIFSSKKEDKNMISLIEYLKNPNDLIHLILVSKDKVSSKGLLKEMLSYLTVIETPVITKSYELSKLLGEVIRKDGYVVNQNVLDIFSNKCSLNYDIAINEFEKLKKIKRQNKAITESDIEEYVSNYNTNDIFSFKDKLINKDLNAASLMIDEMERSKMELIPVVVMLAKEYITLYNIKLLSDKRMSNDQIGKTLNNMHPYRVQLLRSACMKYTVSDLENIILYLCDLDRRLVSEDNLSYDELRKFLLIL